MNWNGKHKNDVLGSLASCRETIAATKQRGMSSPEAGWLLKNAGPSENKAAIISLVASLDQWVNSLPEAERETWLIWAMTNHPIEVRQWMGYKPDWTMMPAAVCKNPRGLVRLAHKGRLPSLYLLPKEPRDCDATYLKPVLLENGMTMTGVELATVTYVRHKGVWHKVHYPKLPSKSAVIRAIRLFLLGSLVGRTITSTTDLKMYELSGIKSWMLYGDLENGIAKHAGDALFHLLVEPELERGSDG